MLTPETVIRLASVENIVGCKDSSGDLTFFGTLVRELGSRDDFTLLTGPEELLAESVRMGGDGGVNGGANLCPELFASLYRALRDSDSEQVRRLQAEVLELGKLYRSRPGAAGVIRGLKYELSRRGLLKNVLAFPALPLSAVCATGCYPVGLQGRSALPVGDSCALCAQLPEPD